jgi:hypothetical protein
MRDLWVKGSSPFELTRYFGINYHVLSLGPSAFGLAEISIPGLYKRFLLQTLGLSDALYSLK